MKYNLKHMYKSTTKMSIKTFWTSISHRLRNITLSLLFPVFILLIGLIFKVDAPVALANYNLSSCIIVLTVSAPVALDVYPGNGAARGDGIQPLQLECGVTLKVAQHRLHKLAISLE